MARLAHTLLFVAGAIGLAAAPGLARAQATPTADNGGARTFALPGDAVFPEGIAHEEGSTDFYVGSTTDGTIFRGDLTTGEVVVFSPAGTDGRTTALGMKVFTIGDRSLIVAGGATGRIFVYYTDSATEVARLSNGLTEGTFLNDVAVVNGDAYVTDSLRPVIWRAEAHQLAGRSSPDDPLEPWLDLTGTAIQYQDGFNLNGIVASDDGAYLLVVQTNTAKLFRIEIATKAVQEVNLGGQPLAGDGLLLAAKTTLFAVADGKVSTAVLTDDLSEGKVIGDFADPSFSSPTTLAREGDCLLVVNSQFANQGGTPDLPFTVSEVTIPVDLRGTLFGTPVPGGC